MSDRNRHQDEVESDDSLNNNMQNTDAGPVNNEWTQAMRRETNKNMRGLLESAGVLQELIDANVPELRAAGMLLMCFGISEMEGIKAAKSVNGLPMDRSALIDYLRMCACDPRVIKMIRTLERRLNRFEYLEDEIDVVNEMTAGQMHAHKEANSLLS
jgi:hypothetical protein